MTSRHRVDLLLLDSTETILCNSSKDDLGIVDDGGIAIYEGKIVDVASSQLLERKYSASNIIRLNNEIILPGFVDPHTHLVFAGSREEEFQSRLQGASYMETLRSGHGILETVAKTRQATENDLVALANDRLAVMLENGTTTVEIKSGYGLREYDELKILRVIKQLIDSNPVRIVPTFLGAHAIPPESTQDSYTRLVIDQMLPKVASYGLARFCDVFCENGAFNVRNSRRILQASNHYSLGTKIHADQFSANGGVELANRLRTVSADHLVHAPESQLKSMKTSNVTPVILPASSDSLLSQESPPVNDMLNHELPVALGTDFSPSNWTLSMLTVAAIAARRLRMNVKDTLRAMTINAAQALGLHKQVGSLEPGKSADIVTLRTSNYKTIGYIRGENVVNKVLIRGKLIVDNGRRV